MKSALQTICFFLLFFFLFLICPSSCTSEAAIDRSAYTKKDFDARICAELDGMRIEGLLQNMPSASDDSAGAVFRVEAPDSLRGITVSVDKNGAVSARLGEICKSDNALSSIADFFLPVVKMGETYSVEKGSDGSLKVRVCDGECDLVYLFSPDSPFPSRISGIFKEKNIDISIEGINEKDAEKK